MRGKDCPSPKKGTSSKAKISGRKQQAGENLIPADRCEAISRKVRRSQLPLTLIPGRESIDRLSLTRRRPQNICVRTAEPDSHRLPRNES